MKTQHTAPADGVSAWQEADNPCQLLFPLGLPRPRCRAGDEPPAEGTSPLRSSPTRAEALLLSQGEALQGFNPRFLAKKASTERCCHILMAAPARRAGRPSLHTHTHTSSPPQASRCWLLNTGRRTSARCSHHPVAAACNNGEMCQKFTLTAQVQEAWLQHYQEYQTRTCWRQASSDLSLQCKPGDLH